MNTQKKYISLPVLLQYLLVTVIIFIIIVILYKLQDTIGYQAVSLILLLLIFLLPLLNFERGPIILSSVLSALLLDYYFIPPRFTFHIAKTEDVVMFFMFFVVAITSVVLTTQLRAQKNEMKEMERVSNALYNLLKDLSGGKDLNDVTEKAIRQLSNVFGIESAIFYSSTQYKLNKEPHPASTFNPDEKEWFLAELSFINKRETGKTTITSPDANVMCFPIERTESVFGVIVVKINHYVYFESKETEFLRNFIKEIILFLEKHINYSIP